MLIQSITTLIIRHNRQ